MSGFCVLSILQQFLLVSDVYRSNRTAMQIVCCIFYRGCASSFLSTSNNVLAVVRKPFAAFPFQIVRKNIPKSHCTMTESGLL